jgi:hypothetical protein
MTTQEIIDDMRSHTITPMQDAADRLDELQRLNDSMQIDRDLWIKVGREKLKVVEKERDEARAEVERLKKCCEEGDKSYQREREAHAECRRDLAMALDKVENQEEIYRNLYYERGLLQSEVQHLNHIGESTEMTRPEPSRLEIAAMAMQGFIASSGFIIDIPKTSLDYADALIAAAKEGK